jgi:hypothetical protein
MDALMCLQLMSREGLLQGGRGQCAHQPCSSCLGMHTHGCCCTMEHAAANSVTGSVVYSIYACARHWGVPELSCRERGSLAGRGQCTAPDWALEQATPMVVQHVSCSSLNGSQPHHTSLLHTSPYITTLSRPPWHEPLRP